MASLKEWYENEINRFDNIKEEIKKKYPKLSSYEVEDIAGDHIDAIDGTQEYVSKVQKPNLFSIAESVRDNYKWIVQEKYDFWNRDLGWSYSQPYHELSFISPAHENIILNLNDYDVSDILYLISSLINDSIKIKEIYKGNSFNYSGMYYEWERVEVHLEGDISKIIKFINQ